MSAGLASYAIPNGVTSIADNAFYYCYNLTNVTIGSSVASIGESAFYYCSRLTSVTIPNNVGSIGWQAFYYCSGLTNVTIGSGVTNIGRICVRMVFRPDDGNDSRQCRQHGRFLLRRLREPDTSEFPRGRAAGGWLGGGQQ